MASTDDIEMPEHVSPAADQLPKSGAPVKTSRILACILCQQRKVKCDRKFPCANCTKARAECIPATLLPRQRRRRYAERDLLARLRRYEEILKQNNIPFEGLENEQADRRTSVGTPHDQQGNDEASPAQDDRSTTSSGKQFGKSIDQFRNVWHFMNRSFRDSDEESTSSDDEANHDAIKQAWIQTSLSDDYLLFGSISTGIPLSGLHPEPVQIFRLWQIYLDNVNPIFKVTHSPTLQGQIIEAASNVASIGSTLEPLMFSIYCMALNSLTDDQCQTMFNVPRDETLKKYQMACQQALCQYNFLRSYDRNCLTALFLYLVSVGFSTVAPSLSALLAVAIRIGQRMGINNEATLLQHSVLEAEMRRRLWWGIVLFDSRITGLSGSKTVPLDPTWTCKPPLNINDSDLRSDMKEPPKARQGPTDAIFAVVRAEVGDTDRHSTFALSIFNPALRPLLAEPKVADNVAILQTAERLESQYFRQCDEDNPLHYMIIWMTRTHIAKTQLLEHHASHANASVRQNDSDIGIATSHAIRTLQYDTKIMGSQLTLKYRWVNEIYFPLPAYIHLIQEMKKRPTGDKTKEIWDVMSSHYEAWIGPRLIAPSPIFVILSKLITGAWDIYETAMISTGISPEMPAIVIAIKDCLLATDISLSPDTSGSVGSRLMDDFPAEIPTTFAYSGYPYSVVVQPPTSTMQAMNLQTPYPTPWNAQMNGSNWNGGSTWNEF